MISRRAGPIPFAVLLLLPVCSLAQKVDPNSIDRECDRCSDLCYLVDQYWQKERGIEVWKRYAASTPERHRIPVPANVTDLDSFEKLIYEEKLPNAMKDRKLPCKVAAEWEKQDDTTPPALPKSNWGVGLETKVFDGSCQVFYGKDKLEGDAEKKWRGKHVCKGSADAELAHEQVHQQICRATWANDPANAVNDLVTFENVAQSELQAWRRHRNLLRDEIQKLARNCGWQPTERQKNDPNAVPTEHQTKDMEERGWKAFEALTGNSP
jgi:hypothetical protein